MNYADVVFSLRQVCKSYFAESFNDDYETEDELSPKDVFFDWFDISTIPYTFDEDCLETSKDIIYDEYVKYWKANK